MSNDLYNEFLNILTMTGILCGVGVVFREFCHNAWFMNLGRAMALGAFATWAMFGWHAVEENMHLRQQLHQAQRSSPVLQSQQTHVVSGIHIQKEGMTIEWNRGRPFGEVVFVESEF